jgi:hypothetical protein
MKKILSAFLAIALTSLSFGAIVAETDITYLDNGVQKTATAGTTITATNFELVNGAARVSGSESVTLGNGTVDVSGGEAVIERRGTRSLVSSVGAAGGVSYTAAGGTAKVLGNNEQALVMNRGNSALVVVMPTFNEALPGFTPVETGTPT